MLAALWAYDGWNNMPMAAGEVKDPGRNVPRALIGGMVAIMVIYCSANLAYFYALPWAEILTSNSTAHRDALPVATKAAQTAFGESGGKLMSIAFVLSALGALNGATLTGARVPFAMARDGLFFARAAVLSPRTHVPVAAVLIQAGVGVRARRLGHLRSVDRLRDLRVVDLLRPGHVGGVRPESPGAGARRPYRTLGYPVVPLVFVLVAAWLVINTLINRPVESVVGLVLIALGLPVYWYYRENLPNVKRIGRVQRPDPRNRWAKIRQSRLRRFARSGMARAGCQTLPIGKDDPPIRVGRVFAAGFPAWIRWSMTFVALPPRDQRGRQEHHEDGCAEGMPGRSRARSRRDVHSEWQCRVRDQAKEHREADRADRRGDRRLRLGIDPRVVVLSRDRLKTVLDRGPRAAWRSRPICA